MDCREQSMIYEKRDSDCSTVAEIHRSNDDHRDEEYRIGLPVGFSNDLDAFIRKTYRIDPTNLGQLLDFSHSIQRIKRVEIEVSSIIAERHADLDLDSIAELLLCRDKSQPKRCTIVDYGTAVLRTVLLIPYQMHSNTNQAENQPSKCDHDMLSSLMKNWINFQRFFVLHYCLYKDKKEYK
uniref:Uncharacterized protein n=1 Tax=Romanomermis culicivorax TaxID=13658 RepID=A0A915IB62_ROMCU